MSEGAQGSGAGSIGASPPWAMHGTALTPEVLASRWAARWPFQPTWDGMSLLAENYPHFPDGHRFPTNAHEEHRALQSCRATWESLAGEPTSRPPVQVIVTYTYVFDAEVSTPVRSDLEDCEALFGGELWRSEPFGARFATQPLGWAHWYVTTGRFGWRRLEPLVAKTVHRHPLNAHGGVIVASPDFSWVWHPYDGGSLVLASPSLRVTR